MVEIGLVTAAALKYETGKGNRGNNWHPQTAYVSKRVVFLTAYAP
ncbi:MAG: hypothetical protein ACPG8W_25410 [Candidatus Promineifilaceae bacterium]